jgi:hypothetical protein
MDSSANEPTDSCKVKGGAKFAGERRYRACTYIHMGDSCGYAIQQIQTIASKSGQTNQRVKFRRSPLAV